MKQQIRAELKQGIVRRWYLYILPFALGAVSTAAFLNRYALLEAWIGINGNHVPANIKCF